ncbi:MAG: type II/IV secretion system protein [Candidatus Taylorbacteria bacterium]|nr:type II/IV secretion system protein [Candidatus Taylorbacteria bacterium]
MTYQNDISELVLVYSAPTLVEGLVKYAVMSGVSDIHIDYHRGGTYVSFRKNGILGGTLTNFKCPHREIIARFKVLAGIRTDEHMHMHDGRIHYEFSDNSIVDLRISIMPTYHGENCVVRILKNNNTELSLEELGCTSEEAKKIRNALAQPQGCICVVGPTGSGKTTTLYTFLRHLYSQARVLVTIEDPVESELEGIRQVQVSPRQNITFAQGLRALLRQDPDVIMVGEMRDKETAVVVMNAALTGHLVVSSLHAKDCVQGCVRLQDLGLETSLIASAVTLLISQRLVRKKCGACNARGCAECFLTGYNGRIGVYEILAIDEKVQQHLRTSLQPKLLRKLQYSQGNLTLYEKAKKLITEGYTTIEEVDRVFGRELF